MLLTIITMQTKEEFVINWLKVRTPSGMRIIEQGHEPLLSELAAQSTITFERQDLEQITQSVGTGFLSVDRKSVILLVKK